MGESTNGTIDKKRAAPKRPSLLLTIDRGVGLIETLLNYIGVTFIILLMLLVFAQVIARSPLFRSPIVGYLDFMEMMMVLLVFLTLAYCQREGGHIRVELFMTRVLKEGSRRYHAVEFLFLLLSLMTFGFIVIHSLEGALYARQVGDSTLTIYMPTWPFRMAVVIGSLVLCLRFLVQMAWSATWAIRGVEKTTVLLGAEREA